MVFLGGDLYAHNERKGEESTWLGWIYHGIGGLFFFWDGCVPSRRFLCVVQFPPFFWVFLARYQNPFFVCIENVDRRGEVFLEQNRYIIQNL